ncbi:hypothetical protein ACJJTC_013755 [Scirpophaga incertulas]
MLRVFQMFSGRQELFKKFTNGDKWPGGRVPSRARAHPPPVPASGFRCPIIFAYEFYPPYLLLYITTLSLDTKYPPSASKEAGSKQVAFSASSGNIWQRHQRRRRIIWQRRRRHEPGAGACEHTARKLNDSQLTCHAFRLDLSQRSEELSPTY